MSLDILLFRKCQPEEATDAFSVAENPELASLQPSGILCAKQVFSRIGRNCMSRAWHKDFDDETTPMPRLVYLPHELGEIKKHISQKLKEGEFFHTPPDQGWDFMFISW